MRLPTVLQSEERNTFGRAPHVSTLILEPPVKVKGWSPGQWSLHP